MAKKKCIVKRLEAIINLGGMDVLCTDKTGTLTQDKVALMQHVDANGKSSLFPLQLSFLNSSFQSGFKNLLDVAVIEFFGGEKVSKNVSIDEFLRKFTKIDEIPFDFVRRRMSVVLDCSDCNVQLLVSKGAVEETLGVCSEVIFGSGEISMETLGLFPRHSTGKEVAVVESKAKDEDLHFVRLEPEILEKIKECAENLNRDGLRVVGVAYKQLRDLKDRGFSLNDECNMIFAGFLAFLDPPKESAAPAIKDLLECNVTIKVLTGDSAVVCQKVCSQVGLPVKAVITTNDLKGLSDAEFQEATERGTIFAKLSPLEKAKVVKVLKRNHVVGFLGDGINDAAALREADVGISVDSGADIAKESADFILLEKSLLVMVKGVHLGRLTFGNTMKYIKMAISSNFGNVFSVLIASAWLPFLPMLPIQILMQNLLYDFSQIAIPWDNCDKDYLMEPHIWSAKGIVNFMVYLGPLSSIFDMTTFSFFWYYYDVQTANNPMVTQFQTAWFIEGLLTQTAIVHMIRSAKLPIFQTNASPQLMFSTLIIMAIGVIIPFIPGANYIPMQPPPNFFFVILVCEMIGYFLVTQIGKVIFLRIFHNWL